jgi:glycosyltransferase involved in cell wall biosynthesis
VIETVTALVSAHTPRVQTRLHSALDSVLQQTRPVDAISVAIDHYHNGAAVTKNRALEGVSTRWTAVLDSDDLWYPEHIELLLQHAAETGADMVYPWFEVEDGYDLFPEFEGQPFDPDKLNERNYIPTTVLVKTALFKEVGGFQPLGPASNPCDDWGAWRALRNAGAQIEHLNRRTWKWVWHRTTDDRNTSGRADLW